MVKIKLLVGRVTEALNSSAGDIIEVSPAEAEALIASEQAEEVKQTPAPEKATKVTKKKATKVTDDSAK